MRKALPLLVLIGWGAILAIQTHALVPVWQSERTLWAYAVLQAPLKPRPWVNYGSAIAQVGQFDGAQQAWQMAVSVSSLPWVPTWDRRAVTATAGRNLHTLETVLP